MDKYMFVLNHFKQHLTEQGISCEIDSQDDTTILKVELTDLGRTSQLSMMEIVAAPYEVDDSQLAIQFFTTIAMNISDNNYLPALDALNNLNLTLPLGSVHIFKDYRQLYHHHTITFDESCDDNVKLLLATSTLYNCIDIINITYDEVLIIADDVSKLEQFYLLVEKELQDYAELECLTSAEDDMPE